MNSASNPRRPARRIVSRPFISQSSRLIELIGPVRNNPVGVIQAAVQSAVNCHERWLRRRINNQRGVNRPAFAIADLRHLIARRGRSGPRRKLPATPTATASATTFLAEASPKSAAHGFSMRLAVPDVELRAVLADEDTAAVPYVVEQAGNLIQTHAFQVWNDHRDHTWPVPMGILQTRCRIPGTSRSATVPCASWPHRPSCPTAPGFPALATRQSAPRCGCRGSVDGSALSQLMNLHLASKWTL